MITLLSLTGKEERRGPFAKSNLTSAKGIFAVTTSLRSSRFWNRHENGTVHNKETKKSINDVYANFIDIEKVFVSIHREML